MQVIGGAYNTAQPQEYIPVEESQSENLTQQPCDARNQKHFQFNIFDCTRNPNIGRVFIFYATKNQENPQVII